MPRTVPVGEAGLQRATLPLPTYPALLALPVRVGEKKLIHKRQQSMPMRSPALRSRSAEKGHYYHHYHRRCCLQAPPSAPSRTRTPQPPSKTGPTPRPTPLAAVSTRRRRLCHRCRWPPTRATPTPRIGREGGLGALARMEGRRGAGTTRDRGWGEEDGRRAPRASERDGGRPAANKVLMAGLKWEGSGG